MVIDHIRKSLDTVVESNDRYKSLYDFQASFLRISASSWILISEVLI